MTETANDGIDFELDDALTLLERTPRVLRTWLDGLPTRWRHAREGPGSWSPHEVVGHLVHGERTDWIPRLRQHHEVGPWRAYLPLLDRVTG